MTVFGHICKVANGMFCISGPVARTGCCMPAWLGLKGQTGWARLQHTPRSMRKYYYYYYDKLMWCAVSSTDGCTMRGRQHAEPSSPTRTSATLPGKLFSPAFQCCSNHISKQLSSVAPLSFSAFCWHRPVDRISCRPWILDWSWNGREF